MLPYKFSRTQAHGAQPLDELHFDVLAVDIFIEIEDVHLYVLLGGVGEGGGDAHVHGGLVASAVHYDVAGVHSLANGEQQG